VCVGKKLKIKVSYVLESLTFDVDIREGVLHDKLFVFTLEYKEYLQSSSSITQC